MKEQLQVGQNMWVTIIVLKHFMTYNQLECLGKYMKCIDVNGLN